MRTVNQPQACAPVSVVIPCYRCESTIGRALQSVLSQTRPPAEIVLVDDASPDGTWTVLEQLAAQDPSRIVVVRLAQNAGAASARNAGWQRATQTLVAFLDADDAWHPRKLELQVDFMVAHPDVVLSGHAYRIVDQWPVGEEALPALGHRAISFSQLLMSSRFATPSVMLRREVPQRFRPGRRYSEDVLLWLEIAASGAAVARLNAALCYLFKDAYGASGQSGQIWQMEKGELQNYLDLHRDGHMGWPTLACIMAYSLAKFVRRASIVAVKRVLKPS